MGLLDSTLTLKGEATVNIVVSLAPGLASLILGTINTRFNQLEQFMGDITKEITDKIAAQSALLEAQNTILAANGTTLAKVNREVMNLKDLVSQAQGDTVDKATVLAALGNFDTIIQRNADAAAATAAAAEALDKLNADLPEGGTPPAPGPTPDPTGNTEGFTSTGSMSFGLSQG